MGEFSASRRASSDRSFLVIFLFIFKQLPNAADFDNEIRNYPDDGRHFFAVDERLPRGLHSAIVAMLRRRRKVANRDGIGREIRLRRTVEDRRRTETKLRDRDVKTADMARRVRPCVNARPY